MKNILIVLAAICAIVLLLALDVLIILGVTYALVRIPLISNSVCYPYGLQYYWYWFERWEISKWN